MEPEQLQHRLLQDIGIIERALTLFPSTSISARISELRADIDLDLYTIVFLGEFNRGKSSLINALLGESILPTDINPTTATINIVRYAEQPSIRLQNTDGTTQDLEFSAESLAPFSGEADTSAIRYLELGMPLPLLRDGVVLVDTPGVDDINDQRVEVTYNFVPRADAVVFVLSAMSPLTRSEDDFLKTNILKTGISRILFVVNFLDYIEEEEQAEFLDRLRNRIATVLPGYSGKLYATSAMKAIQGRRSADDSLLSASGIAELSAGIDDLKQTRTLDKLARQSQRLEQIAGALQEEVAASMATCEASDSELRDQLQALDTQLGDQDARVEKMRQWLSERQREVRLMIQKSCHNFQNSMLMEMRDQVQSYNGSDFDGFVADQLPRLARLRMKEWIEAHTAPLSALLQRIAEELSESLCRLFNATIAPVYANATWKGLNPSAFSLPAVKVPNAAYQAGLIGGGAAALILVLGGPALVPVIGMAGLPFLRDQLHKMNLDKARALLLPELDATVTQSMTAFQQQVMSVFDGEMDLIAKGSEERFEELLGGFRREVQQEIATRKTEIAGSGGRREELRQVILLLNAMKAAPERKGDDLFRLGGESQTDSVENSSPLSVTDDHMGGAEAAIAAAEGSGN